MELSPDTKQLLTFMYGSIARRVIYAILGAFNAYIAVKPDAAIINQATDIIVSVAIALTVESLSWVAKKKLLWTTPANTLPPEDRNGGSSTRIGPTTFPIILLCLMTFGGVAMQSGCAGQQARERIAVPATVKSVDNIAADAAFGIPLLAEEDRATAQADLDSFVEAVKSADLVTIQTQAYARWPVVKALVESGLSDRLQKQQLGPNGYQLRIMRVRSYGDTLEQLVFGPLAK